MFARISPARLGAGFQAGLLIALVVTLAGPWNVPDPARLGLVLSIALMAFAVAVVAWTPGVFSAGAWTTRLDWILLTYVAVIAWTTPFSADRWLTFRAAVALAGQIALFYTTVAVARKVWWLAAAVVIALVATAGLVELMALSYHVEVGFSRRPADYPVPPGWSGYPELSALLTIQMGCVIAAIVTAKRLSTRLLASALALVSTVEMAFLYSRTAWVAFVVMTLGSIVAAEGARWKRALVQTVAALLVLGAVAMAIPPLRGLVLSLTGNKAAVNVVSGTTTPETRWLLWQKTAHMIVDSPVYGVGFGSFRTVFEPEYHPELASDRRRGVHAHNLWLQQTAELGIVGGLSLAVFWGTALVLAARHAHRTRTLVAVALWLALAGATISNLIDGVPYQVLGVRVYVLHWVLLGLVAAQDEPAIPWRPASAGPLSA